MESHRAPLVFRNLEKLGRRTLTSYQKILNFIRATCTLTGLEVSAYLDRRQYPTGMSPLPSEIEQLRLKRGSLLPNWNYTIMPNL